MVKSNKKVEVFNDWWAADLNYNIERNEWDCHYHKPRSWEADDDEWEDSIQGTGQEIIQLLWKVVVDDIHVFREMVEMTATLDGIKESHGIANDGIEKMDMKDTTGSDGA